ncbi:DUF1129 domain-containing protein [Flavihumibacter rivuli]|uniref:DUF1129 domain-containing protein n=1 Tax=Flavihumibacter rivuli TaxID=2838156 RepID=UPI001BDF01B7|nr:DUF1129 domain-containing protein [Flavihumibacter rivuli]ULQ56202.1 DUF1129 domain-containing protein [Flavihumibacter rivuli]
MIAYPVNDCQNLLVREMVDNAVKQELVKPLEAANIKLRYPVRLYTPNVFIRVGLAILTVVIVSAAFGLMGMLMGFDSLGKAFPFILSLLSYLGLEWLIRNKYHFKSGADDMLLYMGLSYLLLFFSITFGFESSQAQFLTGILSFLVFSVAAYRYLDRLCAVAALLGLLYSLGMLHLVIMPALRNFLPWTVALVFAAIFFLARKLRGSKHSLLHQDVLYWTEAAAALIAYAALHYFLVERLSLMLNTVNGANSLDEHAVLPLGCLYWAWAGIIPFLFLYFGIKQHDRLLIRLGILTLVVLPIAIRYYYQMFLPEVAMLVYGTLLIAITYFIIRYLRQHKTAFTYEPGGDQADLLQAENLLIAAGFAGTGQTAAPDTRFGGGQFGGGGAGGEY